MKTRKASTVWTSDDSIESIYLETACIYYATHRKTCTMQGVDTVEARISLARRLRKMEDLTVVSLTWLRDTMQLVGQLKASIYKGCELDYQADLRSYVANL